MLPILPQPSKRSASELSGRNDGNTKVIIANRELEDRAAARAQPGDYVLVKVRVHRVLCAGEGLGERVGLEAVAGLG